MRYIFYCTFKSLKFEQLHIIHAFTYPNEFCAYYIHYDQLHYSESLFEWNNSINKSLISLLKLLHVLFLLRKNWNSLKHSTIFTQNLLICIHYAILKTLPPRLLAETLYAINGWKILLLNPYIYFFKLGKFLKSLKITHH